MIIAALAFLGGVLTILSPCILPVLPFVFVRAEQPFLRSGLPMLLGMAVTFAAIATLAAVGGGWAIRINDYGRWFAMALLALSGLALISKRIAEWMTRPFVAMGNRMLSNSSGTEATPGILPAIVLGVATGFLWAPCAGPILGLILTGAALNGPSAETSLLLFAYALGAMTSMAVAVLAGGRVFAAMKRSFGTGEWLRRGLGVAVLAAVVIIALGWDTGALTRLSLASTNSLEQSLIDVIRPKSSGSTAMTGAMQGAMKSNNSMMMSSKTPAALPVEGQLPALDGAVAWLNSPPLTPESLRGKVVVIDFWTYSCINCLRALPYVKTWYERYKDQGLVVIGIHAPEFAFEKNIANVKRAVADLEITYPIAIDNDYTLWQAFNNQYWPAHYFIDAQGRIRGHHFGEGNYDESEQLIRQLLMEAGKQALPTEAGPIRSEGALAAADESNIASPETYLGSERAANFASPGGLVAATITTYTAPASLQLNQWALAGRWRVEGERISAEQASSKIIFRFHARDLHLVLGPQANGAPVRFRVTIDGQPPGKDHGADTDAQGAGVIREQRLYQLIRQSDAVRDRTFNIEFLDSNVQAYAFTFG